MYPREYICTHGTPTAKITKKIQKNNHVNLCSTRDPIHIHTVINRFRAIASPPRGHRRQAQRSCPLWEEPPEGILDIFLCALVFFSFFGILAVGVPWVQIYSRGYTIDCCQKNSLQNYSNKLVRRDAWIHHEQNLERAERHVRAVRLVQSADERYSRRRH